MSDSSDWKKAPEPLSLDKSSVHVWRDFKGQSEPMEGLWAVLSEEERDRANRFHFERDRKRYVRAHGWLRTILARYLDQNPEDLKFETNEFGKPSLASPRAHRDVRFNLSHSHQCILIAFTISRALGVDVERFRDRTSFEQIAKRFFSPLEVTALMTLPAEQRKQSFFSCWVRKEAFVKALGKGLTIPLDAFDVSLVPGEPGAILGIRWESEQPGAWAMRDLDVGSGYRASLVVEGHGWELDCWNIGRELTVP